MVLADVGLCGAMFWGFTLTRSSLHAVAATVGTWTAIWILVAFLVVIYVGVRIRRGGRNTLLREAAACGGRMCMKCHYPLNDLPETGACPECGEPYCAEELERTWRRVGIAT